MAHLSDQIDDSVTRQNGESYVIYLSKKLGLNVTFIQPTFTEQECYRVEEQIWNSEVERTPNYHEYAE
jgi:hypothetical protein